MSRQTIYIWNFFFPSKANEKKTEPENESRTNESTETTTTVDENVPEATVSRENENPESSLHSITSSPTNLESPITPRYIGSDGMEMNSGESNDAKSSYKERYNELKRKKKKSLYILSILNNLVSKIPSKQP